MNLKVLLALSVLLLGGIVFWLVQSDGDTLLPGRATDEAAPAAEASGPRAHADVGVVEASADAAHEAALRAAVAAANEHRAPIPDDAQWLVVRVVDKATGEPVPDAAVAWHDGTITERLSKDEGIDPELRSFLRRDVEQLGLQHGWQTQSDAQGLARVHVAEGTVVTARREHRYGWLRLHRNTLAPKGGWLVELVPDEEQQVQVLDANGSPAIGIPVAVTLHDAQGAFQQFFRWEPQALTKAPDGKAALRHLQEWREEGRQYGTFASWRVRTFVPGFDDPGVPFPIDAPSAAPLGLRLPPCGAVRARAELHGAPLAGVKTVSLSEVVRQDGERVRNWYFQRRANRVRPVGPDGWARFDHIPLGKSLQATAQLMTGSLRQTFAGPMTQDQEVTVVLGVGADQAMLTGRVVDEARAAVADTQLNLELRQPYNEASHTFRTDAQGRFLVFLGTIDKDRQRTIQRVVVRQPATPLQADLSGRDWRPGVQDAGDVVLKPPALVVAGRFVTGGEPCKLAVQARVERFEVADGRPEPRWRTQRDLLFHKGELGAFEFRGDAPPGRWRLVLPANNHLPVEPIEFTPGATDLVVAIDPGVPLAASVLLPKDSPEDLRGVLVRDGAAAGPFDAATWRQGNNRLVAAPWSRDHGRHHLQWGTVAPGTYTLEFWLWADRAPILSLPGIQVPAPAGGDARLCDVDLVPLVRVATIALYDQDGKPLDSYDGAFFPVGQAADQEWLGYDVQGEKTRLLVRPGPLDLLTGKRGYRPLAVRSTGEDTEARLYRWPGVELQVDGVGELPKDFSLQVRLQPRDSREDKYRSQWNDGNRNELLGLPRSTVRVQDGRARVPIADGPHDVALTLRGTARTPQGGNHQTTVPVELPPKEPLLPTEQSRRIEVPADRLKAAIARIEAAAAKADGR